MVDDQASETDALSRADAGQKIKYRNKSFDKHSGTSIAKSVHVDAEGATFYIRANVDGFSAAAPISGPWSLASNCVIGSVTLSLSAAPGAAVYPGKWVKIVSNAIDPLSRNEGLQAAHQRLGEWVQVKSVSSATLTLYSPLRFVHGLNPTSRPRCRRPEQSGSHYAGASRFDASAVPHASSQAIDGDDAEAAKSVESLR